MPCSYLVPLSILNTCFYLHGTSPRGKSITIHVSHEGTSAGGLRQSCPPHGPCSAVSSHCCGPTALGFLLGPQTCVFSPCTESRGLIMHHLPSSHSDGTRPLSARSLGIRLWTQLCKSPGWCSHRRPALLLKMSIAAWNRRLCRRYGLRWWNRVDVSQTGKEKLLWQHHTTLLEVEELFSGERHVL